MIFRIIAPGDDHYNSIDFPLQCSTGNIFDFCREGLCNVSRETQALRCRWQIKESLCFRSRAFFCRRQRQGAIPFIQRETLREGQSPYPTEKAGAACRRSGRCFHPHFNSTRALPQQRVHILNRNPAVQSQIHRVADHAPRGAHQGIDVPGRDEHPGHRLPAEEPGVNHGGHAD